MNKAKEYDKLRREYDYDETAVEQYAEALMELSILEARIHELQGLLNDNEELSQFVWRTKEGQVLAHHKIESDHLQNIADHLASRGVEPSDALKAHMRKRGIPTVSFIGRVKSAFWELSDGD